MKLKQDRDKSADFIRQEIESPPSVKAPSPKRKPPISLKQDALLCIPYAQAGLTAHFDLKPKPGINLIVENCGKLIHFNEASEHSKPKEMYLSIMQTTNE